MIKPSKLLTTSSNFFQNIFHLIKIVHLQIKFKGPALSELTFRVNDLLNKEKYQKIQLKTLKIVELSR